MKQSTMPIPEVTESAADLSADCETLARRARSASRALATVTSAAKNQWLLRAIDRLHAASVEILAANGRDVAAAESEGLTTAQIDRLRLTPDRLEGIAASLREVAALPDPVGHVLARSVRSNGLQIQKVSVPLEAILFIDESRPNVTVDAPE